MLRFPVGVAVVFVHMYAPTGVTSTGPLSDFVRNLVSEGAARIAVPFFFLASGYLLFRSYPFSIAGYLNKLGSRARTLFIPFLFWNAATLLLIGLAESLPATRSFVSSGGTQVTDFTPWDYLNTLLGVTHAPIAYQFWFVRDLLLMVLLSPLVQLILRVLPRTFLVASLLAWYLSVWPFDIPSSRAVAFFYGGAFIAARGLDLFALDRFGPAAGVLYVPLLLADALTQGKPFNPCLQNTGILAGLVFVLYVSGALLRAPRIKSLLLRLSSCGFFVYAIHEPLLTVFRKIAYRLLGPASDLTYLATYLLVPTLLIGIALLIYAAMERIAPTMLLLVSGGRARAPLNRDTRTHPAPGLSSPDLPGTPFRSS